MTIILLVTACLGPVRALAQGTAFTYQGSLGSSGTPVDGLFDFVFSVWDSPSLGNLQGASITTTGVAVSNGLFTVSLDFGAGVFTGAARWIQIGVRTNNTGPYITMTPRQPVTSAPYSITAQSVTGPVSAGQIVGTIAPSNIGFGSISSSNLAPNAALANLNAAGQSGVASSGLVLSATDNNTNLSNAGYIRIYGSFDTPDSWQAFSNAPSSSAPSLRHSHTAVWTGSEMIVWGGFGGDYLGDGALYNPTLNTWTALAITESTPSPRLQHTAVWTGSQMIIWGGLNATNFLNDGGIYDPVLNSWTYIAGSLPNAPAARLDHTAVWTGSEMIVWGGSGTGGAFSDGGIYNPGLNSWTYLASSVPNTPGARINHTAVWSGSEMIVWGGAPNSGGSPLANGGRYNPLSNTWTSVSNSLGVPAARQNHSAVWTGSAMIVWGGDGASTQLADGALFYPQSNAWTYIPATLPNTPTARDGQTAVWTGSQMIVWGGYTGATATLTNDGASYSPASNNWAYIASGLASAPPPRYRHSAVWTGAEMVIWGGTGAGADVNDGGRYNPALNTWTYLPGTVQTTPPPRLGHTAVWTGNEMIVWGGANSATYFADGGIFNPALNSWTYIPGTLTNSPTPREFHSSVWTGSEMIVWGGVNNAGFLGDGGRFNPASMSWINLPNTMAAAPAARANHTAVWSGAQMIVWGGNGNSGALGDGGQFNPASDTWTYIPATLANSPPPRAQHTAVWTGTRMIVWGGGSNNIALADGGVFNSSANTWTYLSNTLSNSPPARLSHAAVWTGNAMIVWGGSTGATQGVLSDGGIFNPASSAWSYLPATLANAPAARQMPSAVWTGVEMVIWGGENNTSVLADGGRYNPAANTWTYVPATLANNPAARSGQTAVWTGSQILVWGGGAGSAFFNDTFGYTPGRALYLYERP